MFYRLDEQKQAAETFSALPDFHPDVMAMIVESDVIPTSNHVWDGNDFIPQLTDEELLQDDYDQLVAHSKIVISEGFITDIEPVTVGYSSYEIDSWNKQETEARVVIAGQSLQTPLIDNMIIASGLTRLKTAEKIISKADNYLIIMGEALGKKEKFNNNIALIESSSDDIQIKMDNIRALILTI